ncbi:MAG: outer membrane beta-barrel protein [Vicinamibacteria bacterium]|nr:outer membrane beta-barrel protein [Vicinamibacteria bacterium]
MRRICLLLCALLVMLLGASPAHADLTAFIGAQSSPSTRMTRGISGGSGFLVVAFEGEYAQAGGDDLCPSLASQAGCAPSVRTVMFNGLVQTPKGIVPKVQLYATVGGGYYRVRFESQGVQDTGFGTNVGGGVKIDLAGPLRLRLDYRLFKLTKETEAGGYMPTAQRFYAGVNLAF